MRPDLSLLDASPSKHAFGSLRDLYGADGREISILYGTAAENTGMDTNTKHPYVFSWRAAGIIVSALLFVLSLIALMLRPGDDSAIWRGLALSSLYVAICLSQRRLFVPTRARSNRRSRW